jgi:hypothetical protein
MIPQHPARVGGMVSWIQLTQTQCVPFHSKVAQVESSQNQKKPKKKNITSHQTELNQNYTKP